MNNLMRMGNPQALLGQALAQNPELKQVLQQCNGNYQKAFYTYAQQKGIDPEQFLNSLR